MRFKEFPFEVPQTALDHGFEDISWHNDAAAAMSHEQLKLLLWVDFPKREDRDYPEQSRFTLVRGDYEHMTSNPIFEGESEDELSAYLERFKERSTT